MTDAKCQPITRMDKKITQLDTRSPQAADLLLIGDPSTGYAYKAQVSDILNTGVKTFNTRTGDVVVTAYSTAFSATGGETTFTNAGIGSFIFVSRNGIVQENANPSNGDSYYTASGTTITFSPALAAGERIFIQSIKL